MPYPRRKSVPCGEPRMTASEGLLGFAMAAFVAASKLYTPALCVCTGARVTSLVVGPSRIIRHGTRLRNCCVCRFGANFSQVIAQFAPGLLISYGHHHYTSITSSRHSAPANVVLLAPCTRWSTRARAKSCFNQRQCDTQEVGAPCMPARTETTKHT